MFKLLWNQNYHNGKLNANVLDIYQQRNNNRLSFNFSSIVMAILYLYCFDGICIFGVDLTKRVRFYPGNACRKGAWFCYPNKVNPFSMVLFVFPIFLNGYFRTLSNFCVSCVGTLNIKPEQFELINLLEISATLFYHSIII